MLNSRRGARQPIRAFKALIRLQWKVAQLCIREEKIGTSLFYTNYINLRHAARWVFHCEQGLSKASCRCLPEPISALQSIDIDCSSERWRSYAWEEKMDFSDYTYTATPHDSIPPWCTGLSKASWCLEYTMPLRKHWYRLRSSRVAQLRVRED
jgi:hypothetical protein